MAQGELNADDPLVLRMAGYSDYFNDMNADELAFLQDLGRRMDRGPIVRQRKPVDLLALLVDRLR